MDILEVIGSLSSFITVESRIKDAISDSKYIKSNSKLDNLREEISKISSNKLDDMFAKDKLENYIYNDSNRIYPKSEIEFISEAQKNKIIDDFFKKNPYLSLYDKDIISILNVYFDKINNYSNLLLDNKSKIMINHMDNRFSSVNNGIKSIDDKLDNINKSQQKFNIYKDQDKSSRIINKCISINSHLLQHVNISLWKKDFERNYFCASSFIDVSFRIKSFLNLLNLDVFNDFVGSKYTSSLEALFNLVKKIAPDLSTDLDYFYNKKIIHTVNCIDEAEIRSNKYYISIGALGLYDNNSDEMVYEQIMDNLMLFFTKVENILNIYFKENKHENLIQVTTEEMHSYLLKKIKYMIDKENVNIIKFIYDKGKVKDTCIPNHFKCDINSLRKMLYPLTKEILDYSYNDNQSTILYIRRAYLGTFKLYYDSIFGGNEYED